MRWLHSFCGAFIEAVKYDAHFFFPYSDKVWRLVECLRSQGLVRYYSVHEYKDKRYPKKRKVEIVVFPARQQNGAPICRGIRLYRNSMSVMELKAFYITRTKTTKTYLIGWSPKYQAFREGRDLITIQKTSQPRPTDGFQWPVMLIE